MCPQPVPRATLSLFPRLLHGLRKGVAYHDIVMWGLLQMLLAIPVVAVITGLILDGGSVVSHIVSPWVLAFWSASALALAVRLHHLATNVGCLRQINVSEDGYPARCLVDLGDGHCCKHLRPGESKTACPYWRPELIVD
jgi:hypothetical protein